MTKANTKTLAVIGVTHRTVYSELDYGLDLVDITGVTYHRPTPTDEYEVVCGNTMGNPTLIRRNVAEKLLMPCRKCWEKK